MPVTGQAPARHRLTAEQVAAYDDDGYLVVDGVFTEAQCAAALALFEPHAPPDFGGIMNLDRTVQAVRDICADPAVVGMLEQLQRAEVSLLQSMFLFKRAGSPYAAQAWSPHQDNAYPQAEVGAYLTANIAYTDQDVENGCMFIYPGSHREGLLPFRPAKSFHEEFGARPGHVVEVPSGYHPVDLPLKRGSVVFLHGCVIHGSHPNTSVSRSRPMLLIPYITAGKSFIPGKVAQRKEIAVR